MAMSQDREVDIRPFTPADLGQCTEVEQAVYGSGAYSTYFFRQLYDLHLVCGARRWLQGGLDSQCGGAGPLPEAGHWPEVARKGCRARQGIGQRLLEKGVEQLLAFNVRRIRVTSEPDNTAANRLYEKLGFRAIGVESDYYGDGADRLIFEFVPEGA